MIWLLGGYLWLFVHRPFEIYYALGEMQLERGYMFFMVLAWLVCPNKSLAGNRLHVALGCFSMTLLAAWLASPYANKPGCVDTVENYAKVAVFYFLVVTTVRDERQLRLLVLLFLVGTGLYMAHSMWEFLHGRYEYRMGIRRMIGVDVSYRDPNAFASTLLYTLPLLLPFWNEQPRRLPRVFILGYAFGVISCILLTGSRAGFMGLSLFTILLLLISAKRKGQAIGIAFVVGFVGFAVLSVALPAELQNRYLTLVDSSRGPANAQTSAEGRLDGFMWGMYVWQQSPLLGHGPGSFGFSTGREGQAHNLYGQVMSEMGALGAVCLLAMVICFYFNWQEARHLVRRLALPRSDVNFQIVQAVSVNVVLLLVMGWAGHNLFRYNWQWFASFSAIAVHCLRIRAGQEQAALELQSAQAQFAWQ